MTQIQRHAKHQQAVTELRNLLSANELSEGTTILCNGDEVTVTRIPDEAFNVMSDDAKPKPFNWSNAQKAFANGFYEATYNGVPFQVQC